VFTDGADIPDPVRRMRRRMRDLPSCAICAEIADARAEWLGWLASASGNTGKVSDVLPLCREHVWQARAVAGPALAPALAAVVLREAGERLGFAADVAAAYGGSRRLLDRLERAFKRQRDFVSDASHELRTPLAVLRAQVELLDREADQRTRHEGTVTLLRRLDELDRLVGDMLTLASAEAGQLIEPETIDLRDFFEDLRRDLPLFGDRDYELSAIDGTLHGDPDRLTQVLRNLIRNAVAQTAPGDRVAVLASTHDGRLEISVSDAGAGIPPDELERIFERFHRVDGGRSRDRGGSGLGLAIARAIIEAHGGSIRAESIPGHGATFRLDLPGYRPVRGREDSAGSRAAAA